MLDIHYPARNVVAILVNDDYVEEFVSTLLMAKVKQLDNYSPLDPTTIVDPKYQNLSDNEKKELAKEKHNSRIARALPFVCDHISRSVARFFLNEGVLTQGQFDSFVVGWNDKVAAKHGTGNKAAKTNETENAEKGKGKEIARAISETPKPASDDEEDEFPESSDSTSATTTEQQQQQMEISL